MVLLPLFIGWDIFLTVSWTPVQIRRHVLLLCSCSLFRNGISCIPHSQSSMVKTIIEKATKVSVPRPFTWEGRHPYWLYNIPFLVLPKYTHQLLWQIVVDRHKLSIKQRFIYLFQDELNFSLQNRFKFVQVSQKLFSRGLGFYINERKGDGSVISYKFYRKVS